MSHPLLKAAIRLFCTSILLITSAQIASACVCPVPTVLDAYEAAGDVLIVRVLSAEKIGWFEPSIGTNMRTVKGTVQRVYKGNLKVNEQLTFHQQTWCALFNEAEAGGEMLVYLAASKAPYQARFAPGCGRTKSVLQAGEDLLYLDNMDQLRGKTRVSGNYGGWRHENLINFANRKIRIVSERDAKVHETVTNEKGVFEVYDLPPGQYRLEPEMPAGWRIDRPSLRHLISTAGPQDSAKWPQFVLAPRKHASVSFAFQPDNALEGRIVGPEGNALAKTCAYLRRPQEILGDYVELFRLGTLASGCADENGHFRIESVLPGTYVLVLNVMGKPRSSDPFPRVFHPGTTELEKATTITIAPGQFVKDMNVVVPFLLETITAQGVLYRSDGKPVPKQEVRFEAVEKPGLDGLAISETDERGRFSLKILKGLQGTVYGGMAVVAGTFHCPELKSLNYGPQDRVYVRTKEIKIEAVKDLKLDLHLLYPDCTRK